MRAFIRHRAEDASTTKSQFEEIEREIKNFNYYNNEVMFNLMDMFHTARRERLSKDVEKYRVAAHEEE